MKYSRNLSPLGDAALRYSAQGFFVLPVHGTQNGRCSCGRKCNHPGKHPRIRKWPTRASSDARQISEWWKRWPSANVGILTGHVSNLVVLDVDGAEGLKTLRGLLEQQAGLSDTYSVRTGSGGLHLYYAHPGFPIGNKVRFAPGLDLRGDGGMAIAAPSVHSSGRAYELIGDKRLADLPTLPEIFHFPRARSNTEQHRNHTEQLKKNIGATQQVRVAQSAIERLSDLTDSQRQAVRSAIELSVPAEPGVRNRQVFNFVRRLQAVEGIAWKDVDLELLRPLMKQWYDEAQTSADDLGFVIKGTMAECWDDFRYGWSKVKVPFGGSMSAVVDVVKAYGGQLPDSVQNAVEWLQYDDPDVLLLLALFWGLSESTGGGEFYLSTREAEKRLAELGSERDRNWVWRTIRTLERDRVIECVKRGKSGTEGYGKSSEYRWAWKARFRDEDLSWLV
ncbi:MAG: bifunctional DNA primase/polymerase [Fuerstiella sp.]